MKTPRVADFDPSTRITSGVHAGELHSPLDNMPAIEKPGPHPVAASFPAVPSSGEPEQRQSTFPSAPPTYPTASADPIAAPRVSPLQAIDGPSERSSAPPAGRLPVRPSVRVYKRTITRYSFEFYRDQIESLRELSLEEKQRGEAGSMSAMVREAIDAYLARRHRLED
jgi:hypothetical protein